MKLLPEIDETYLTWHVDMFGKRVADKLDQLLLKYPVAKTPEHKYLELLINFNGKAGRLLVAPAADLRLLTSRAEALFRYGGFPKSALDAVNDDLSKIFDYDAFMRRRGTRRKRWGGMRLLEVLSETIKFCPYCNAETVYAIKFKRKPGADFDHIAIKSALDHFYPRSRYPFLALSLYNLIPSCTRCNSGLKRDKHTRITRVAHPYIPADDLDVGMRFIPILRDGRVLHRESPESIDRVMFVERDAHTFKRGRRYEELFAVGEVYTKLFRREASDAIWRAVLFDGAYVDDVRKRVLKHGLLLGDVERLVYGTPVDSEEINRHRLAKLRLDMIRLFRGADLDICADGR